MTKTIALGLFILAMATPGWCRSIGGKVVGISYRRVSNLLYCCLRCLHLRTSQILPTDQASPPHLTAAQEAEEQEQHGLFAGE